MARSASSFVITGEGFTDEVKLEQGSKLSKGANHLDIWGKNILDWGSNKYEVPEVGVHMLYVRNKEASMAGMVYIRGETWGKRSGGSLGPKLYQALSATVNIWLNCETAVMIKWDTQKVAPDTYYVLSKRKLILLFLSRQLQEWDKKGHSDF